VDHLIVGFELGSVLDLEIAV